MTAGVGDVENRVHHAPRPDGAVLGRWLQPEPVVLARDGDLRQRLRLAGLTSLSQVNCAVLEANGQISVLRDGPVAPELLADLRAASRREPPRDR